MKTYAVIGTGNMGGALARALRKKLPCENIVLFNRTAEKARRLAGFLFHKSIRAAGLQRRVPCRPHYTHTL